MTGWWQLKNKNRTARERTLEHWEPACGKGQLEKIVCVVLTRSRIYGWVKWKPIYSVFFFFISNFTFWVLVAVKKIETRNKGEKRKTNPIETGCLTAPRLYIGQGIRRMSSAFKIPIKDKSEYFGLRYTHTTACVHVFCSSGRNEWRFFDASVSPSIVA